MLINSMYMTAFGMALLIPNEKAGHLTESMLDSIAEQIYELDGKIESIQIHPDALEAIKKRQEDMTNKIMNAKATAPTLKDWAILAADAGGDISISDLLDELDKRGIE